MGRLTLNPMSHADPVGTIIFPILGMFSPFPLIGWARPVPVNEANLRDPKKDMFWIAAAGPLSNLLLATIGVFAFEIYQKHVGPVSDSYTPLVGAFVGTNLGLMIFNLIPIHPLDGGKVIARFLPDSWNRQLEEHQNTISMALFALMIFGGLSILRFPIYWTLNGLTMVARSLVG